MALLLALALVPLKKWEVEGGRGGSGECGFREGGRGGGGWGGSSGGVGKRLVLALAQYLP